VPGVDYAADISLAAIRPRPGQWTHAIFGRDALPSGRVPRIIWKPPITSYNGWTEQPSEIAQSCLLTARTGILSKIDAHHFRYDFEVLACEPLLPALQALVADWTLQNDWDGSTVSPQWLREWEEVDGCAVADIDGFRYLSARLWETSLELLVQSINGEMFALLSTNSGPGGDYCFAGRRRFSAHERGIVEAALKDTVRLTDSCQPYLRD